MSPRCVLISILALTSASGLVAEETGSAEWLPFPFGIADSNGERAFVLADNEVLALELPAGKEVWRVRSSALPVFAMRDTVVAIEPKANHLLVFGISKVGEHIVKRFGTVNLPGPARFSRRIDPGLILNVRLDAGRVKITLALPRSLPQGAKRVDESPRRVEPLLFGVLVLDWASGSTSIELSTNVLSKFSNALAVQAEHGVPYRRGGANEQNPWLVKGGTVACLVEVNNRPSSTILQLWQNNGESLSAMNLPSWDTNLTPLVSMDGNSILLPASETSSQLDVLVFDIHHKQSIARLRIETSAQQVCIVQNHLYYLLRHRAAAQSSPDQCEIRSIDMRSGEHRSPFAFVDRSAQVDKALPP